MDAILSYIKLYLQVISSISQIFSDYIFNMFHFQTAMAQWRQSLNSKELPHVNLVFIGPSGSGKSTMLGHLIAESGAIDACSCKQCWACNNKGGKQPSLAVSLEKCGFIMIHTGSCVNNLGMPDGDGERNQLNKAAKAENNMILRETLAITPLSNG